MAGECNPDPPIKEVLNTEPKNLSRAAWDQEQVGIREDLSPLPSLLLSATEPEGNSQREYLFLISNKS